MREHPIPQDISAYRFHIIGNMTLKQFAEIGFGCFIAFLIYASNLPEILKWPLIGVTVAIGAMVAFVPIEERPLDHWIITFFRVMYRPTQFYWKREPKIPDPFTYKNEAFQQSAIQELDLTPARRERIKEYLGSLRNPLLMTQEESDEYNRIQNIMMTFQSTHVTVENSTKMVHKPNLSVRVRSLAAPDQEEVVAEGDQTIDTQTHHLYADHQDPAAVAQYQLLNKQVLQVTEVAQDIAIPEVNDISTAHAYSQEHQDVAYIDPNVADQAYSTAQATHDQTMSDAQAAQFNATLPFPSKPTEPNKLVGMVLAQDNSVLSNAIIEIQTANGQVARAIKTNALGQFFVTTPLESGVYTLLVEKDGYSFAPQQIELVGDLVEPVEIRSLN